MGRQLISISRTLPGARAHLLSLPQPQPFSLKLKPLLPQRLCKPYRTSSPASSSPIKMSSAQIIEHMVLFKVKPDTDPSKVSAMVNGLNALISLDQVAHITAGPVLRTRSSSLTFTHMLHSGYHSKDDLNAYAAHPAHVNVVTESVRLIVDDIMAVDWVVNDLVGPVAPPPGSAMRITFLKMKEGLGEKEKDEVLEVIGGIGNKFPSIKQLTFGENFCDRAKGYSIASLAVFPGLSELDSNSELVNSQKDKARDFLESVLVLDYVVPTPQSADL